MKKFISIILTLAMLFSLTACGDESTTQTAEPTPDYSKICFHGPNTSPLSQLTDIKDRDGIMECFRILKSLRPVNYYTAKITLIPDGFEDVNYSSFEINVGFSLEDMTLEEIAESLEKISAIPDVKAIDCYFSYIAKPTDWDD